MAQKITPFLWFNDNAEEAVNFYTSIFQNSKVGNVVRYDEAAAKASGMKAGAAMTVPFELAGQKFTALNGGPVFKFTHALSFFVQCETEEEIDKLWEKLSKDSPKIFWPLKEYPFSKKYAWVTDRFGLSWQLNFTGVKQRIAPFLMFDGKQLGKAEEAMNFYVSVFSAAGGESIVKHIMRYGKKNERCEGFVVHGVFKLAGQDFLAMDSGIPNNIDFNESLSFVVNCETQKELDYFWEKLSAVPEAEQCGWLKDKYGISWQIIPDALIKLLSDPNKEKSQRVMQAMLKMKKIDIAKLEKAYNSR
jgi:predicted 3-demethylubiquinone-9 3-methyltransferase (glyoxalase superfamily)